MRVATISTLSVLVALLLAYVSWNHLDADDPDPEPPARKVAAGPPWPAEKAARITYDRASNSFVLTNVSPDVLWFFGEKYSGGSIGAHPITERQLPTGEWINVTVFGCKGEFMGMYPLAPGRQVSLGGLHQHNSLLDKHFPETKEAPGEFPARVGIRVKTLAKEPEGAPSDKMVHSDAVRLPRVLIAEQ